MALDYICCKKRPFRGVFLHKQNAHVSSILKCWLVICKYKDVRDNRCTWLRPIHCSRSQPNPRGGGGRAAAMQPIATIIEVQENRWRSVSVCFTWIYRGFLWSCSLFAASQLPVIVVSSRFSFHRMEQAWLVQHADRIQLDLFPKFRSFDIVLPVIMSVIVGSWSASFDSICQRNWIEILFILASYLTLLLQCRFLQHCSWLSVG